MSLRILALYRSYSLSLFSNSVLPNSEKLFLKDLSVTAKFEQFGVEDQQVTFVKYNVVHWINSFSRC